MRRHLRWPGPRNVLLRAARLLSAALLTVSCTGGRSLAPAPQPAGQRQAPPATALPAPSWQTDSMVIRTIAEGVVHRSYVSHELQLAVQVLDIDLAACWTFRSAKAGGGAVGRATTSALAETLVPAGAIAAVNADFFLFAPPGVSVGLTISQDRLITGPNRNRPVFAVTEDGTPWVGFAATSSRLELHGGATGTRSVLETANWNQLARDTVRSQSAVVSRDWGDSTPPLVSPRALHLAAANSRAVANPFGQTNEVTARRIPGRASYKIPTDGWLWLLHGPQLHSADSVLSSLGNSTVNGTLKTQFFMSRLPFSGERLTESVSVIPREAIGGNPMLVRDSTVLGDVDTNGNAAFRGVNPRTALGIASRGRRVFLVVIDGRQPGHSRGTTLRETADIMRALGAHDAINLDGGGSSAMVIRNRATTKFELANKPSDKEGERPVADALVVVPGCSLRSR